MTISYNSLQESLNEQELFEGKTWKLSPEAFPISENLLQKLEDIGTACLEFQSSLGRLYNLSKSDKKLLRNEELKTPWVFEYYDKGKPDFFTKHSSHKSVSSKIPRVLRPDLLISGDNQVSLTELDSVPGGIGLTAFIDKLYSSDNTTTVVTDFYNSLQEETKLDNPHIAIVVSDEAETYRPEMEWLADVLRKEGKTISVAHPNDLQIHSEKGVFLNDEKIDLLYRFWELFDFENFPNIESLISAVENQNILVSPPLRPFQEEKLSLALFHHHRLENFWKENLSKKSLKVLKEIIPPSWIIDEQALPPGATLQGPELKSPLTSWTDLKEASKKERNLIIKISGFDENAWGSRSVTLGSDVSQEEWARTIDQAINPANQSYYIVQEFRKPTKVEHPIYNEEGQIYTAQGRVRLCPYYFVTEGKAKLSQILVTFCPADKKIIHGMTDAAMLPVKIDKEKI